MVEIRFKPADVGTVADGAVTNVKIATDASIDMFKLDLAITDDEVAVGAGIAKNKLGALNIVNADVEAGAAIEMAKLTLAITNNEIATDASVDMLKIADLVPDMADKVDGIGTTGDKKIGKIGWDSATEEFIIDHEA